MADIKINAMGDTCPIPVVKTKKAMEELAEGGKVLIQVDNEIAVQNLVKMAEQKQYGHSFEKLEEGRYEVTITVGGQAEKSESLETTLESKKQKTLVSVGSDQMGEGNEELGKVLMKGFLYALTQLEELPDTILFYNSGAVLTTEGSDSLEDLKILEEQGVKIYTCGTCLNFYHLSDKVKVGSVTNMYSIVEMMDQADKIIKP